MRPRLFLCLLAAALLASRLAHSGILWPEDGLPLAAAVQMLHGKAVYHDIWYDKPPLVPAFYLPWGAPAGAPLRIVGALYVFAACTLLYRFGRELWGEHEGRWSAALLAFFLIFGVPSAVIAMAADLLTLVPHIAAVYLAFRGAPLTAGACAGAAFLFNSKALFVLAACALWLRPPYLPRLALGFAIPTAAALGILAVQGSLGDYWAQVWRLGAIYARDTFVENPGREALVRTVNWAGFHAALVLGAASFWNGKKDPELPVRTRFALWVLLALVAVVAGWRFFPRYYLHLLPPLSLAAARGFVLLGRARVIALALLVVPLIRFGPRYVSLALHGDAEWRDTAMDRDSRQAAKLVLEHARPGATLFVWGYRPDIFVYTRMPAASRFLESQPLTGVFADRHLMQIHASYPEWAAKNRKELVQSRPAFIVDGIVKYNPRLAITQYPDLQNWLENYEIIASTSGAVIYQKTGDRRK